MREIKITCQAEDDRRTAEIYIYDAIGDDGYGGGVSAKGFAERLDEFGPLDEITVRLNSPGGSAWDGAAIYSALVRNKAHKIIEVDGIAASAASFILMAGDVRRVSESAMVMIHCASGLCYGPADEMEKTAVLLRKLDDQIASTYASRTHRKADTWLRAMQKESWYSAAEAVKERLADEVIPNKQHIVSQFRPEVLNRFKNHEKIAALLKQFPQEGDWIQAGTIAAVAKPDTAFTATYIANAPEEETDLELDDEEVEGPLNTSPVDVQARLAEYAARVKEVSSVQ